MNETLLDEIIEILNALAASLYRENGEQYTRQLMEKIDNLKNIGKP